MIALLLTFNLCGPVPCAALQPPPAAAIDPPGVTIVQQCSIDIKRTPMKLAQIRKDGHIVWIKLAVPCKRA